MKTEKDQNMLFGATGVAIVVLVVVLFQAKKFLSEPKTEHELVSHVRATTAMPTVVVAPRDFADSDIDDSLEQYILDAIREIEPGVRRCLERWPGAPESAKARLRTDVAGRLSALSIQGARPDAERCFGVLLQRTSLPRRADGVVRIAFPQDQPAVQEGPGGPPREGDTLTLPPGEIYWGE